MEKEYETDEEIKGMKPNEIIKRIGEVIELIDIKLEDINNKLNNLHLGLDLVIEEIKMTNPTEDLEDEEEPKKKINISKKDLEQI